MNKEISLGTKISLPDQIASFLSYQKIWFKQSKSAIIAPNAIINMKSAGRVSVESVEPPLIAPSRTSNL